MSKKDLIKQLHNLNEQIKPDAEWKTGNRDILMSQIKAQTTVAKIEHASIFNGLMFKKFIAAAYRPVAAMVLIVGIVLGGYTMTVGAAKNSLPGDFLYPIKLTGERMRVNLAGDNDEKKVSLEIEFAERRLAEMKKVAAKTDDAGNKKENLKASLKKYQESINNVKSGLSKLEKNDSETALKVAKLVDGKTQDYVDILKDQQSNEPEISKVADTKDAITASKSMAEKALDMIINEYKAGSKEVTIDLVMQSLEKKLKDLNSGLDRGSQDLDTIIANMALAKQLEAKKAAEEALAAKAVLAEEIKPVDTAPVAETNSNANVNVNTNVNAPVLEPIPPAAETNSNANVNVNVNTNVNALIQEPTPVEAPAEVLPIPEVAKVRLVEIKNLLIQANAYLSTKEVLWSYSRMKDAQDLMVLINKVIEANKQYLEEPQVEVVEPAKEEASADTNANVNSVSEVKQ